MLLKLKFLSYPTHAFAFIFSYKSIYLHMSIFWMSFGGKVLLFFVFKDLIYSFADADLVSRGQPCDL